MLAKDHEEILSDCSSLQIWCKVEVFLYQCTCLNKTVLHFKSGAGQCFTPNQRLVFFLILCNVSLTQWIEIILKILHRGEQPGNKIKGIPLQKIFLTCFQPLKKSYKRVTMYFFYTCMINFFGCIFMNRNRMGDMPSN